MMSAKSSFLVCFSLGTCFLLLLNHVHAEDINEPRKNVNLSPFWGWRSAYDCLINASSKACSNKEGYQLRIDGALIVQDSDIKDFCKPGGCFEHTKYVLSCIQDVKRDFHFATKQNVSFVNTTITNACAHQDKGFNTNVTKKAT